MHGRMRTTPAEHVCTDVITEGDTCKLVNSGEMREAELLGEIMILRRKNEFVFVLTLFLSRLAENLINSCILEFWYSKDLRSNSLTMLHQHSVRASSEKKLKNFFIVR